MGEDPMRTQIPEQLERARITDGRLGSDSRYGSTGAFVIQGPRGARLKIVSSEGDEEFPWEHVSVSVEHRIPNWLEMAFVKDLFWGDEEAVMQLHPPRSQYVNCHPNCLHLWRPLNAEIPLPDPILVGPHV
jgi:hypothetical protein